MERMTKIETGGNDMRALGQSVLRGLKGVGGGGRRGRGTRGSAARYSLKFDTAAPT